MLPKCMRPGLNLLNNQAQDLTSLKSLSEEVSYRISTLEKDTITRFWIRSIQNEETTVIEKFEDFSKNH